MNNNIYIGYHGCEKEIGLAILNGQSDLLPSHNKYDWLGDGMYFWENDAKRALDFAKEFGKREPFVIGAAFTLGNCLDLTTLEGAEIMKHAYDDLLEENLKNSLSNKSGKKGEITGDLKLRYLDCAVFRALHEFQENNRILPYDSVRAGFWEGEPLYPNAGFREKNHIQICIRNSQNIIGFFRPRNISVTQG